MMGTASTPAALNDSTGLAEDAAMDRGRYRSATLHFVSVAAGFTVGMMLIAGVAIVVLGDGPRPAFGIGTLAIPLVLLGAAVVASVAPVLRPRPSASDGAGTIVTLADVRPPASDAAANGAAPLRRAA